MSPRHAKTTRRPFGVTLGTAPGHSETTYPLVPPIIVTLAFDGAVNDGTASGATAVMMRGDDGRRRRRRRRDAADEAGIPMPPGGSLSSPLSIGRGRRNRPRWRRRRRDDVVRAGRSTPLGGEWHARLGISGPRCHYYLFTITCETTTSPPRDDVASNEGLIGYGVWHGRRAGGGFHVFISVGVCLIVGNWVRQNSAPAIRD